MGFEKVKERASEEPIIVDLPTLSQFYLPNHKIYESVSAFEQDLYDPNHLFSSDVIIRETNKLAAYPTAETPLDPFRPKLNQVVDWTDQDDYNRVADRLLPQSSIKKHIRRRTAAEECVALVIIDGLSFETVRTYANKSPISFDLQPAFVDGVSTTDRGFRRIIYGHSIQSINAELNMKGFTDHLGFTYWDKGGHSDLSTDLHRSMHEDKIHRIRDFHEIHRAIEQHGLDSRTYIQVTRMGLDQECHNRKEHPDVEHHVTKIFDDLAQLRETLASNTDQHSIYLTSDHGILWREGIRENMDVIDVDSSHPRYVKGSRAISKGIEERVTNESPQVALAYPYMTRDFKHTEWGVHGGLSYQESLIPLVEVTSS